MEDFIKFENVSRSFQVGEVSINALCGVSFSVGKGEICVIVGESGAGKTTLLNILGGMDVMTGGSLTLDGKDISGYNKKQLTAYRRHDIGFVFQFYNLIPNLTAAENVELSTQICSDCISAEEILTQVGLSDRVNSFPAQLSGGEQQRVAIARALAKKPKILLCDEPTGALDYNTGKAILRLLESTCRQTGMTVVIVTHNSALCGMADRVVKMRSGKVESVTVNEEPTPVELINW